MYTYIFFVFLTELYIYHVVWWRGGGGGAKAVANVSPSNEGLREGLCEGFCERIETRTP